MSLLNCYIYNSVIYNRYLKEIWGKEISMQLGGGRIGFIKGKK